MKDIKKNASGEAPDLAKLKELALAHEMENNGCWFTAHQLADGVTYEESANFILAASPAVVLDLIARIERAGR